MTPFTFLFTRKSAVTIYMVLIGLAGRANPVTYAELLSKPFYERIHAMHRISDSVWRSGGDLEVLSELKRGAEWATKEGDKQLADCFKLWELRAMLYQSGSQRNLQVERELINFIDELKGPQSLPVKAHAMFILADYYWSLCIDYKRAMEFEFRLYEIYKDQPVSEWPVKVDYVMQLAGRYYNFRDYENTKRLLLDNLRESGNKPHHGAEIFYNLLGLCYRNLEIYDSAVHYFNKGYQDAIVHNHTIYQAIIGGNIGISYYYQQRYAEAIPLLEKDIRYCLEENRASDNASKSLAILGDIFFKQGRIGEAAALLQQARDVIKREGFWKKYEILEFVYPITAKILASQGNLSAAYAYLDSSLAVRDSLTRQKNTLILAGAQNLVAAQMHLADVEKLTEQKKVQVIIRNSLIAGLVALGLLTALFINRQKIINRRKQERLHSEKQLMEVELSNASSQLQMFTRSIHEKNALIEEFSAQLESLQPATPGMPADYDPDVLARLRESTILTDNEWEDFRRLFETVHGDYLERLKVKIPGLSPAETRFIALTKLQLSNKEMAGILGISTDAVRMNKHRLRKKLNLDDSTSIDELLGSL